jgi:glucose-1-phosphate cytidylyltransferase
MEHDGSGKIIEFNEKPQASGWRISGGFFVCNQEIFKYFDSKRDDETLEADPMHKLARDGQMMMFRHDGFWQCMDTYRDFAFLNELVN